MKKVPHDVHGLDVAHGSFKKFSQKLDSLFTVSSEVKGANKSQDVRGLIGQYVLGSPMFDELMVQLSNNKTFVMRTKGNAKFHPYIQSVRLKGKSYSKIYIDHTILLNGGVLEFTMGAQLNKQWDTNPKDWPQSANQ